MRGINRFAPACCAGWIAQIHPNPANSHVVKWKRHETQRHSLQRSALQTCEVAGGGAGLYMYRQRLEPKVRVNQCGIACIRYCYCRQRIHTFSEPVLFCSLSPYCSCSETRSLEVKGQQGSCSEGLQCSSAQGVLIWVFCLGRVKFGRQHQRWRSDRDDGHDRYFNVF